MLQEILSSKLLPELLRQNRDVKIFPPATDRASWERLDHNPTCRYWLRQIIDVAESYQGKPWPELTATLFMAYAREGSRVAYENPYFERRNRLGILVLAECIEHKGRYMDEIIDGIWHMISEPDWCLPAHAEYLPGDPLAKPYTGRVDLFCAVSGMQLAETVQLLKAELTAASPSLMTLLREEVIRRVVVPVESYPDGHWWLDGFNNWTPWCSSNVTGCALTFLRDPEREAALISKLLVANDRFIANYRPDGGCDEGPMYWAVAAGKLLFFMDLLDRATGGRLVPVFQSPLFRNMGEYIVNVHLCRDWFLSPADSCARITQMNPGQLYRFADATGSKPLRQIAVAAVYGFDAQATHPLEINLTAYCGNFMTFMLRNLFWLPDDTTFKEPEHHATTLLSDLQIFIARQFPLTPEKGLIMSLKGGNNGESHNHNDVGQFELFSDGNPLIIDTGVATYCKQTFSPQRNELWYINAQGHNIPAVNGIMQQSGKEYQAKIVTHDNTGMTLDLTHAYPATAGIKEYSRRAELDANTGIATITDAMSIKSSPLKIEIPIYTAIKPNITATGLQWSIGNNTVTLQIEGLQTGKLEPIAIDDERLRKSWPSEIYRIRFCGEFPAGQGKWQLRFSRK